MNVIICLDCHNLLPVVPGTYAMCESCKYEGGKSWYGKGYYCGMESGEFGVMSGLTEGVEAGKSAELEFRQGLFDGENLLNTFEEMNPVHTVDIIRP